MPHHHHHPSHHPSSSSSAAGSGPSGRSSNGGGTGLTSSFLPRSFAKLTQVGDTIPAYIPGFRTSAAFLSSLSANLQIQDESLVSSPIATPSSFRAVALHRDLSTSSSPSLSGPSTIEEFDSASGLQINIPPPYNLPPSYTNSDMAPADSKTSQNPEPSQENGSKGELPQLSTHITTVLDERIDALKLVADSMAQQRQFAARSLIGHPANAGAFVLVAAVLAQFLHKWQNNWPLVFTTLAGIAMSCLVAVRYATQGYIRHAEEEVTMDWLGDDTVIVTKFGDEVIGTAVLGWQPPLKGGKKAKGGKGLLKAWTVRLKYRGKGEGKLLLDEAAKFVKSKGGDGFEVENDNLYSKRFMYKLYNAGFDRRDKRVQAAVERAVSEQGGFQSGGKKR